MITGRLGRAGSPVGAAPTPDSGPAAGNRPAPTAPTAPAGSRDWVAVGPGREAQPRLAFLSNSSAAFDARTLRMARSAVRAGYRVTVYARLQDGLPAVEARDGYRLVRVAWHWWLAVPGLRQLHRRRSRPTVSAGADSPTGAPADDAHADDARDAEVEAAASDVESRDGNGDAAGHEPPAGRTRTRNVLAFARSLPARVVRRLLRPTRELRRLVLTFPLRPMGWAVALEEAAEPADIWHGMWAGSLPALDRLSRRHGGRTVYDSRDVYMESREYARLGWPIRNLLSWCERRWARRVDRVLTVNDSYAALISERLRVPLPAVVMNCPETWHPPEPRPDLIREALGLPRSTRVVLYHGQLTSERGIEQAMEAILGVSDAALVLLGFGRLRRQYEEAAAGPPYLGRVFLLEAVPPGELIRWTASADVSVMPIQPTTLNHRFTTPQKLFESLSAGVPVVASNMPGMAAVIHETRAGVLVDPTSPGSIARGIRSVIDAPRDERDALRARALRAAHGRFNWEVQRVALLDLYRELLGVPRVPRAG